MASNLTARFGASGSNCGATIVLSRAGGSQTASGPSANEWVGMAVTSDASSRVQCGFDKTPFRIEVSETKFRGTGKDVTGTDRAFEGEIDDDGKVNIWSEWAILTGLAPLLPYMKNASDPEKGTKAPAKLTGSFVDDQFQGSMYVQHSFRGSCTTKLVLNRVGSQVAAAGANADAERQRLAAEVARLKAEAERSKLEQEVARLKAEAARPAAPAAASRPTNEAETALWNEVRGARTVDEMQRYLEAYPAG